MIICLVIYVQMDRFNFAEWLHLRGDGEWFMRMQFGYRLSSRDNLLCSLIIAECIVKDVQTHPQGSRTMLEKLMKAKVCCRLKRERPFPYLQ